MAKKEIAIEIHFDAGGNTDQSWKPRPNRHLCFRVNKSQRKPKNVEYQHGILVSWVSNGSPRAPTSSYEGGIQALLYGCDVARMLEGLLAELMFGGVGVEIPTYVRSGNSDASYQVDSANTATNEKRPNGFLGSNREALEQNIGLCVALFLGA